jgi:hypothetical protein
MNPIEQHNLTTWKVTSALLMFALVLAMALVAVVSHDRDACKQGQASSEQAGRK